VEPAPTPKLAASARATPLGILLLAAVLGVIGTALILAGIWVMVAGGTSWVGAGIAGILVGPAILYLVRQLIYGAQRAWTTLLVATTLLFISSMARIVLSPDAAGAALLEIAVESGMVWYLTRPRIRRHFRS